MARNKGSNEAEEETQEEGEELTPLQVLQARILKNVHVGGSTGGTDVLLQNHPEEAKQLIEFWDNLCDTSGKIDAKYGNRIDPKIEDFNEVYNSLIRPDVDINNLEDPIFVNHETRTSHDVAGINQAFQNLGYKNKKIGVLKYSNLSYIKYFSNYVVKQG